jgi:exosome complex component RRP43
VVCINYDGNAFDAAVLAVMAALKSSKFHVQHVTLVDLADGIATLSSVRYEDESGRAKITGPERHPLPLGSLPLSCTFGIFQS